MAKAGLKQLLIGITISLFPTSAVLGDESADIIGTAGTAQLERITDYLLFSTSNKTSIRIPEMIRAGEPIQYQSSDFGKSSMGTFVVVYITIRGDLCWLHSKSKSRHDATMGDTIYVQPCRRVQ